MSRSRPSCAKSLLAAALVVGSIGVGAFLRARWARPLALVLGVGVMALITTAIVSGRDTLKFKGEGVKTATLEDPDGNILHLVGSTG